MSGKKLTFIAFYSTLLLLLATAARQVNEPRYQPPPPFTTPDFVDGEIIVKFQSHVGMLGAQNSLLAEGIQPLEASEHSGLLRVQVTPGREKETIAGLLARGDVEFAGYNYRVQVTDTPNDFYFSSQWALNQSTDHDIDAPEAWNLHPGTNNVTIAILDTGVDLDHPDLQANIVAGYDFVNDDNNPDDDHGHGTHVAGIAAATGNNGIGIAGVSWDAKIMPVKVLSASGSGNIYDITDAIYYAVDNGARVINMSLGARGTSYPCYGFDSIRYAMQYALNHGALVMVASGNDYASTVSCPAAYDEAIAVGSTTSSDTRSSFSNQGSRLDISAPGSNIYSTVRYGGYGTKSGTSMATPHVVGLAALIWSYAPSLSNSQVRVIIENSADDLGIPGWDPEFGYGRINAANALGLKIPLFVGVLLPDGVITATSTEISVSIQTISPNNITWTAAFSPTVPWLEFASANAGVTSVNNPATISLRGLPQTSYTENSTNLIITSTTLEGEPIQTIVTTVNRWNHQLYLPMISQ